MPVQEMTSTLLTGVTRVAADTQFGIYGATLATTITESRHQNFARSSYTLANSIIKVVTNTITGGTTALTSRKNLAAGALSATITAETTGFFEDTTNTDSLVAADEFDYQIAVGTGTSIIFSMVGCTLTEGALTTFDRIQAAGSGGSGVGQGTIAGTFQGYGGTSLGTSIPESEAIWTFRFSATLSNMYGWIPTTGTSIATLTTRINLAAGAQSATKAAAATGAFEDAVNTDSAVAGDEGTFGIATDIESVRNIGVWEVKMVGAGSPQVCMASAGNSVLGDNYAAPSGVFEENTTESNAQMKARSAFTGQNLFVNVKLHGVTGGYNIKLRKNTADTSVTVSIGDSATGVFEDTTNTAGFVSADLYNYLLDRVGSANTITMSCVAFTAVKTAGGGGGSGGGPGQGNPPPGRGRGGNPPPPPPAPSARQRGWGQRMRGWSRH